MDYIYLFFINFKKYTNKFDLSLYIYTYHFFIFWKKIMTKKYLKIKNIITSKIFKASKSYNISHHKDKKILIFMQEKCFYKYNYQLFF